MKTCIKIAYIGGGSRAWARKLMSDLVLDEQLSGDVYLYDIDFEAAKDNEIIGSLMVKNPDAIADWRFKAVNNIEEALTGCDVVIISVLPGTFKEMQSDVHTPERYGVYQPVGDTVGLGGYMRAMRCAPIFKTFARKIKEICPESLVINYTNPMTLCTRILIEEFPQIKIIGCCHEVFSAQYLLAKIIAREKGISEPHRSEIKIDVSGINHFTWIAKAEYKGEDIFPIFERYAGKYAVCGFDTTEASREEADIMLCKNIIKFEMYNKYGVIPAAGDRHLAEFLYGQWYLSSPARARQKGFNLTPVSWRIKNQLSKQKETKDIISGKVPLTVKHSGEEGVRQIKAFLGLGDLITNVNCANMGQISNYPKGSVVETNALISLNSIAPIPATPLPFEVDALILKHVYHQEAFIRACNNHDAIAVKNIIADDPQCSFLNLEKVDVLFDIMYNNTKSYIDFYWNKV